MLRSDALEVRVDTAFPRIVSYTDRGNGSVLHGRQTPVTQVLIDGTARTPAVRHRAGADRATYTLTFDGGTEITVQIAVEGWQVTWRVTRIKDTAALRVGTLEIPDLALLSVRSDQPGATLLAARIELDKSKSGDTLVQVTADTPVEAAPTGCAYAVVATDELAAAVETNTVQDKPAGATTWENGRLLRQTVRGDGWVEAQLRCGQWTYRAAGQSPDATDPLPYATVIVTRDRNGDGRTDWQDAAIALRDIMVMPLGADEQHLRVVPHIPFNFASQATNPFLATLDNIKRIALATDGLRQFTLLKGYQSEGHDSAHPDYGGNYNKRAGGLADLNALVRAGKKWHSDFAVHVNATESYPVAHAFSETLVNKDDEQWDWLDQSYRIDARRDLVSGDIARRFAQLRKETDPALNTLYIDVFRESGWNSDRLQRHLRDQGWQVTTEWGHGLERSSLWSHWANEPDYGGDTSRGINSRLIRFVRNHHKDVFADKWPTLLGAGRMGNFEGWVGKTDWHAFHKIIWTDALPAKYLQAHPIKTWDAHEITFEGPTRTAVSDADGTRKITTDGRLVYDGGTYLLPWQPRRATDPDKLYHYNPEGGTTSWALPRGWSGTAAVYAYRLTDQGRADGDPGARQRRKDHPDRACGHRVRRAPRQGPRPGGPSLGRGHRSARPRLPLGDARRLAGRRQRPRLGRTQRNWATTSWSSARAAPSPSASSSHGPNRAATPLRCRSRSARRRGSGGGRDFRCAPPTASPRPTGPRPPRRATTSPPTASPAPASSGCSPTSPCPRAAARSPSPSPRRRARHGCGSTTYGSFPRSAVARKAPWSTRTSSTSHRAGESSSRATPEGSPIPAPTSPSGTRRSPSAAGTARPSTTPSTAAESLKSRGENTGLVYRTVPHSVRFTAGRRYRVGFRYENEKAGQYAWVTAVDTPATRELTRTPLPVATQPATYTYEFTAPADGEAWVGLRKVGDDGKAEFVLDTFEVREL